MYISSKRNQKCFALTTLTPTTSPTESWSLCVDHALQATQTFRVKSDRFGHQVNLDTRLQTLEIQMRRLLMSRLIRIFTVCLVNLFFIPITELWNKQGGCPNLAVCPNIHYRPSICPCRIRVENALKTHVKRISFPTRISKIQSKPTIDTHWTAVQRSYLLTNQ